MISGIRNANIAPRAENANNEYESPGEDRGAAIEDMGAGDL